jgi:hypothetical protein
MKTRRIKRRRTVRKIPCRAQEFLLTRGELAFYHVLVKAVGDRYIVFAKVRIRDLLQYPDTISARPHLNRISQKHVDFVICECFSTRIVAGLELDDRSHEQKDRAARDRLVNDAFDAASVPLIRIKARREYSAQILAQRIGQYVWKGRNCSAFK